MAKSLDIIDPKKELEDNSSQEEEKEERVMQAAPAEEGSGSGVFYLVIGIIAVLVSASLALYILFKDNNSQNSVATTASSTPITTVSPETSAIATQSATSSVTTTSPTASSTFKYTNEVIRIANGNSTSGEAARIKAVLEAKGYKIATIGNATKPYADSIIYYKTGQEKLAAALKADIASEYVATIELSDQIVGTNDAVVVLGTK